MPRYRLCDGEATAYVEAADLDAAKAAAEDWLRLTDLEPTDNPIWLEASVVLVDDEDEPVEVEGDLGPRYAEEATVRVRIDPPEPPCKGGQHDWQSPHELVGGLKENPGVWGNAGGVRIREVCARCGWFRVTDTWYQDDQGRPTTAVLYREPDEDSLEWVRQHQAEEIS